MYTIKVKLYPNNETYNKLLVNCNASRFIYNWGLETSIKYYEKKSKFLSYCQLASKLKDFKEEYPWLKGCDSTSLQQSLKDLNQAFKNFFRRLKKNKKSKEKQKLGFPKFKSKFKSKYSFRCVMNLKIENNKVKIGKYKDITFRCSKRDMDLLNNYKIRNITVSKDCEYFYASILIDYDKPVNDNYIVKTCGIDVGVSKPFTLVYKLDGDIKANFVGIKIKNKLTNLELKRKKIQRSLSRKIKGSNNRNKYKLKLQRTFRKETLVRKDFIEKYTTKLSNYFKAICLEDLKLKNMTKSNKGTKENPGKNVKAKSGLNREMLRIGFYSFKTRLLQKLEARNKVLVLVNPKFTSQTCNKCGYKYKDNRKSQSNFTCIQCGHTDNADVNAALNIKDRGIKVLKYGDSVKYGKVA